MKVKFMKCNIALFDRILRFIFGVALTAWAVAGGPSWGYFGIYLLITSGWGLCIFYAIFKINTIKELRESDNQNSLNTTKDKLRSPL